MRSTSKTGNAPDSANIQYSANLQFKILINEHIFDFSKLVPVYGPEFVERLGDAWISEFSLDQPSTTKIRLYSLRKFLLWVPCAADFLRSAEQFLLVTRSNDFVSKQCMLEVVDAFTSRVRDFNCKEVIESCVPKTRSNLLESLSTTLQRLAKKNLWPNIGPIKSIDARLVTRDNVKSLGEIKLGTDKPGKKRALREEIAAVNALNAERLEALRTVMVRDLEHQYALFQKGQKLLRRSPPISLKEIRQLFEVPDLTNAAMLTAWAKSGTDGSEDNVLSCLLHWIKEVHGGLVYTRAFPHRVQKLISLLGKQNTIIAHLEGTRSALFAAHTIVLIDTGFNVQTCDDLPVDPFVGSVAQGRQAIETIAARKRRAKGKVVEAVIPFDTFNLPARQVGGELSAVNAIRMWKEMSGPIRSRVRSKAVAARLWIIPQGSNNVGQIKIYSTASVFGWWKRTLKGLKDHPVLGGLDIQRKMIRPTVLQISASKNRLSHVVPQALAGHSSAATTYRYLSGSWFKQQLNDQIQHFQGLLESVFANDIEEYARKLGIDPDVLVERQGLAEETGLGFLCSAVVYKDLSKKKQAPCTEVENCANCNFRKFVPTVDAMEALYLTNESLRVQADEFQAQNPDRWTAIWMPFLALTEALILKLNKSRYRSRWKEAEQTVQSRLKAHQLELVRLW